MALIGASESKERRRLGVSFQEALHKKAHYFVPILVSLYLSHANMGSCFIVLCRMTASLKSGERRVDDIIGAKKK